MQSLNTLHIESDGVATEKLIITSYWSSLRGCCDGVILKLSTDTQTPPSRGWDRWKTENLSETFRKCLFAALSSETVDRNQEATISQVAATVAVTLQANSQPEIITAADLGSSWQENTSFNHMKSLLFFYSVHTNVDIFPLCLIKKKRQNILHTHSGNRRVTVVSSANFMVIDRWAQSRKESCKEQTALRGAGAQAEGGGGKSPVLTVCWLKCEGRWC